MQNTPHTSGRTVADFEKKLDFPAGGAGVGRKLGPVFGVLLLALAGIGAASAQSTWNSGVGGSWATATDWSPAGVPAAGADIVFNGAATIANPAQTANRSITLDGTRTAGSILFNNDLGAFTNSVTTGTGGPLVFDAASGPATITANGGGTGTGNSTVSVAMTLTDSLVAIVNNTTATSAAGALNLTAAISGPGGFTKQGDGLATFGTGTKTYTGATILDGGRMRMSQLAHPTATSSVTINAGAQLNLISASTYGFGGATLNLNGSGATSGPYAAFPGAIRNDTNLAVVLTSRVVLQSDTLLQVPGSASGSLSLSNVVSGPGGLTLTAPGSDANQGQLVLDGANSYAGSTVIRAGLLTLGSSATASLGAGDVTVMSGSSMVSGASARLAIPSTALNAITDVAVLSLAGGNVAGVADDGYISLAAGVNEWVGGLILGGTAQGPGTYGSTASAATFQNDEYFSGSGILTVIPEPAAPLLVLLGALVCTQDRRRGRGRARQSG
ncbi:MAG: autotransporter-associated beta strand repeat protein [Verrucomicrobiales bacterium]|nr:autotransporter-associated beta strand repeat protein [Verrucomicrobiales bacterium]